MEAFKNILYSVASGYTKDLQPTPDGGYKCVFMKYHNLSW